MSRDAFIFRMSHLPIRFGLRCLVRLKEALDVLEYFLHLPHSEYSDFHAMRGLFVYLKIATEILKSIPSSKTKLGLYNDFKIEHVITKLKQIVPPFQNPANEMAIDLKILDVKIAMGEAISVGELDNLYFRAIKLQSWGVALESSLLKKRNFLYVMEHKRPGRYLKSVGIEIRT